MADDEFDHGSASRYGRPESATRADKEAKGEAPAHGEHLAMAGKKNTKKPATAAAKQSRMVTNRIIEMQRVRIAQAFSILACLYEALLYADDGDSLYHADCCKVTRNILVDVHSRLETEETDRWSEEGDDLYESERTDASG